METKDIAIFFCLKVVQIPTNDGYMEVFFGPYSNLISDTASG